MNRRVTEHMIPMLETDGSKGELQGYHCDDCATIFVLESDVRWFVHGDA